MYNLIVIGGGPAGYLASERAAAAGMNVLLFEKQNLGGVCLNEGCIPSKTLLNSAKIYDYANGGGEKYGVFSENPRIDYPAVVARKDKVVKKLVAGIRANMKKLGVTVILEAAKIQGRGADGLFEVSAAGTSYFAEKLLIATGSQPTLPPITGLKDSLEQGFALTNREILALKEIPENLTIVGGGVIGLEIASLFNSIGSKVTVLEMLDKIAGYTDRQISEILLKNYEKKGINFILSAKVTEISTDGVAYELNGTTEKVKADKVLVSIGRRAVTADIGLDSIGVVLERGNVLTDEQMKTNVPGVFAAGDVNGKSMLAHTAYREAEVAVNVMLGKSDRMLYSAIPSVIYTNPEVAGIGETLESAKESGIDAREVTLPMAYSGRYMAENEGGDGIAKIVLDGTRLIGFHMIGNPASEIISTASVAISREVDLEALKRTVFPHPTVAEILRELIFS